MKNPSDIVTSTSPLRKYLMTRPRVDEILDMAAKCKLVYVIAGAGYGKTTAVQNYINKQKGAVVRWLQLTDSDNIGSHYWENFTHCVSIDNPELAADLSKLGFPETLVAFKQFADILRREEHQSRKTFLVLDDFHLINSKKALVFAQRCAGLRIPGACVIIISRKEPDINTLGMLSKGNMAMITQEDLCFTENEVKGFFEQQKITCTSASTEKIAESTKGWPLAINLLSLVLRNSQTNLESALKLTTQNIDKLFESEAWSVFPDNLKKILVKLSLVSNLPAPLLHEIFRDTLPEKYMPELASFVSYDSFCNNYIIHPLYLSFLEKKQKVLTKKERQSTYQKAATWCLENGFFTSAVKYYAETCEYEQIIEVLRSYPGKFPHDSYKYFLELIEKAEPGDDQTENLKLARLKALTIPYLLIGMRDFKGAGELTETVMAEWEQSKEPAKTEILINAYNALAHISKYTCMTTHEYKMLEYLEKAAKLSDTSGIEAFNTGIFALPEIRSFACFVGESASREDFTKFADSIKGINAYAEGLSQKKFYGYEEWVACEVAFFRNDLSAAAHSSFNGVMKARENSQYGIEMMLKQYMLRIALHKGDYSLAKEILEQISDCVEGESKWGKQLLYELIKGWFYTHIGIPDMVSSWIFSETDKDESSDFRIPMRELIVSARYYLACKKYTQALAVLSNSYPRLPHERFLFSELIFTLLMSVAELKTGDTEGAVKSFEKAYKLSFNGYFEMPFIEIGKHISLLTAAVRDKASGVISETWLDSLERKAAGHAKNTAAIARAYKRENKLDDKISLSEREREVLGDMCRGLLRDEIAAHRCLSINTVKKIVSSLYLKLNASNNLDAVRIAFERKLVD